MTKKDVRKQATDGATETDEIKPEEIMTSGRRDRRLDREILYFILFALRCGGREGVKEEE